MSDQNHKAIFCENLKQLRMQNYLSRKIMAEKLGVSVHALAMIEAGKIPKRLTMDVLFTIEEMFNISCADMFKKDSIIE